MTKPVSAEEAQEILDFLETDAKEDNEESIARLVPTVKALWPFVMWARDLPCAYQAHPCTEEPRRKSPCFGCQARRLIEEAKGE